MHILCMFPQHGLFSCLVHNLYCLAHDNHLSQVLLLLRVAREQCRSKGSLEISTLICRFRNLDFQTIGNVVKRC